jgi:hypothetical protein
MPGQKERVMSEEKQIESSRGLDPMAILSSQEQKGAEQPGSHKVDEAIEAQNHFLWEVPQAQIVDPRAALPLNSDRLIGSVNMVEKSLRDVSLLIEEEVASIQKHQKRITDWEDLLGKNRAQIKRNEMGIKQNHVEAFHDRKNRDYWFGRAEEVEIDYSHAEVAARHQDWAWLIKKYGLKNPDGSEIQSKANAVEELCNGEIKNLVAQYRATGTKYEVARKEKEAENTRLVRENAKLFDTNEVLQGYISVVFSNDIEPLQDGILLLKALSAKLKVFGQDEKATYGEMRHWAESFLSDFIRVNSKLPQAIVTHFRKLTSIPLPPEYC